MLIVCFTFVLIILQRFCQNPLNKPSHVIFDDIELLIPIRTEVCHELKLVEERKSSRESMRERTSYHRLMVDRVTMKVVIAEFTHQGEIESV